MYTIHEISRVLRIEWMATYGYAFTVKYVVTIPISQTRLTHSCSPEQNHFKFSTTADQIGQPPNKSYAVGGVVVNV